MKREGGWPTDILSVQRIGEMKFDGVILCYFFAEVDFNNLQHIDPQSIHDIMSGNRPVFNVQGSDFCSMDGFPSSFKVV